MIGRGIPKHPTGTVGPPKARRRPTKGVAPDAPGLELVRRWFAMRGWTPWPFQEAAWAAHARGSGGLIEVPTGAGKTYAAYMGPLADVIDELRNSVGTAEVPKSKHPTRSVGVPKARTIGPVEGVRVLYITPLRAVARDIELALRRPIEDLGLPIEVEGRTGDTPSSVRLRQKNRLPNVLVTTPESLSLMLTHEAARERFAPLRAVIADEWHEMLGTKRGTQVELALARLRRFAPGLRTWALSATIPNLDVALAAAMGADAPSTDFAEPKSVARGAIIRGGMKREVLVDSVLPSDPKHLPWAGHLGLSMLPDVLAALDPAVPTIVFTNTRSQAERWFHAIRFARPEWAEVIALHHGSIDRAERERVEGGLKDGTLRIVVATSSLDLGVDFAPVERVMQIGSPKGIARVAQRAGRAAHRPMTPCRIVCVPTHALELVEIDAARKAVEAGDLEPRMPLDKPLDVLAQHLVTCALGGGFTPDDLYEEVRTAWSFRTLTCAEFNWALELVKNGGGTLSAYPDFKRVAEVEGTNRVPMAYIAQLHRLNVGTIVADSTVEIAYVRGRSLGRIEENFIGGLNEGQEFVFAGKTLKFAFLKDMVAYVRPATGGTSFTPIWGGNKLPISEPLAQAIREALQRAGEGDFDSVELAAARPLIEAQQRLSAVPAADEVLVETCVTRDGAHLFLFPFEGRMVHAGIAAVLALRLARVKKATLSTAVNDYGLEVLGPKTFPFAQLVDEGLFALDGLVEDAVASVNLSQLAKLQFREIARVAGLVFENYPGQRKSPRQVRASSSLLFDVFTEFDPGNMLLHQARREVLERHFEQGRLGRTMARIARSKIVLRETRRLTPLSFPLLIERQSARLSTQTIRERLEEMQKAWTR